LSFFALVAVARAGVVSYDASPVAYHQPLAYAQPTYKISAAPGKNEMCLNVTWEKFINGSSYNNDKI
jgi:hypothetical protein